MTQQTRELFIGLRSIIVLGAAPPQTTELMLRLGLVETSWLRPDDPPDLTTRGWRTLEALMEKNWCCPLGHDAQVHVGQITEGPISRPAVFVACDTCTWVEEVGR